MTFNENEPKQTIQEAMPILDRVCANGKKYEDIVLLNVNHDMKNTYVFSSKLLSKFGKVIQIGASYSPSTEADRYPFRDGIYYHFFHNHDKTFSIRRNEKPMRIRCYSFSDALDMMITLAVAKDVLPEIRNGKKLFIIEDGGYHCATLANLVEIYPELENNVIGSVEQTTSGTKILSSQQHCRYPSFSIARSEIKMCLESVFIGQKIVEELSAFLAYTNHFLNFAPVMIIGYGIFGRAVAKKLEGYRCRISVCDTDEVIRQAAQSEGLPACAELTAADFHDHQIFIAMTGNKSFGKRELLQFLESDADQIILSSGSSKDIEFKDILNMIQNADDPELSFVCEETGPFFEKYSVSSGMRKKTFYLIANGMPVNFCREGSISLTDRMIDLIFAEMTLCAESIVECPTLQNRLYLLGSKDVPVQLDEWKIVREWFEVNGFQYHPEESVFIHPCREYLRQATFRKQSMDSLL